jgi:hypothetical protein
MNYSLSRVGSLIKRDLTYHREALVKPFAIFIGLNVFMLIIYLFESGKEVPAFWSNWHFIILFGYSLISTFLVFPEFKDPQSKQQFFSVPATTLEKYSVRWIYSMIAVPLIITAVFMFFHMLFGGEITSFYRGGGLWVFIAINALMFLCASSYNNPAVGLSYVFLVLICLVFVSAILMRIVFHPYFDGWTLSSNDIVLSEDFHNNTKSTILNFVKVFLGMGMPIAFWVISYFKLKEQQA